LSIILILPLITNMFVAVPKLMVLFCQHSQNAWSAHGNHLFIMNGRTCTSR